jgi:hypothetical protein
MHSLTIAFGEGQMMSWRLLFTNVENAQAAFHKIAYPSLPLTPFPAVGTASDAPQSMEWHRSTAANTVIPIYAEITDDFGQSVMIKVDGVKGLMLEDMEHSQLGDIAMRLHGARTQAMAVSQANADPKLRAGGSIQPAAFNGGFPRQN